MDLQQIPQLIFDDLATDRWVESHNLPGSRHNRTEHPHDQIDRDLVVATCDMDNGVWLRLGDGGRRTSLEVLLSDDVPYDPADPWIEVYGNRTATLARLSAGLINRTGEPSIFASFALGSAELRYPFDTTNRRAAQILHAAPIIGEIASKAYELLAD